MRRFFALPVVLALAACASRPDPIVDMKGVDRARYEADLSECREYARQVDPAKSAAGGALFGGAAGAGIGAATGAVRGGHPGYGAALGGAAGGSTGLFAGAARGAKEQAKVVKTCLRGRGYRVLN